MATRNPFKAFMVYAINPPTFHNDTADEDPAVEAFKAKDPTGQEWGRKGLHPPYPGDDTMAVNLDGAGRLMCVRFNERILPGKVRDEHLLKRVKRVEEAESRSVNAKEYAQLRDEVEGDLLPKAFIRRTDVMLIFAKDRLYVFTSSQKKADSIIFLLGLVFKDLNPWQIRTMQKPESVLTALVRGDAVETENTDDGTFTVDGGGVFKGEDKRIIRVKDVPLRSVEVQELVNDDPENVYECIEADLAYRDDHASFSVNSNLTFKRMALPGIKTDIAETKGDLIGLGVLCLRQYREIFESFVDICGGIAKRPEIADDL